jgi:hypothetical protein
MKRNKKKISYNRLLEIARKMHLEIFLMTSNEEEVYNRIGLTPEENAILGYCRYEFKEEKDVKNV